jgi:hypothetical protein
VPSTADILYPSCHTFIHHIASVIENVEVDLHCKHTQVSYAHTLAVQLPLKSPASTNTNNLHKWEQSCRKTPSQHQLQPRPRTRTSCRCCNLTALNQLPHTDKILSLTPHNLDHSRIILINCSLLQSVILGRTNSYTLAYHHPVLHLLARVQIKRTAATQLRKLKDQGLTRRPSTSCALQQESTSASQATRNKHILLARTRVTARTVKVQQQRPQEAAPNMASHSNMPP